jgi:uncharacterized protein with beta-barrel porin domain
VSAKSLRRQVLLSSTMLVGALTSYGGRAYAACAPTGGGAYSCSGANLTTQTITANEANVGTVAGFSVDTTIAGGDALHITGNGALFYTDTGQLFGEIAYPTSLGSIALEPFAGIAGVRIDTESFKEHGGELSALRGRNIDEEVGYSTLGLRAGTIWHWRETVVAPHVSAAWQHAFDDVTPDAVLAFASTGIGFTVTGVPLAEDSALIEAGLDFALGRAMTLGVSYAGQLASDLTDNAVKGRFTWIF